MKRYAVILLFAALACYMSKVFFHYSPYLLNVINDLLAIPVLLMVMEFLMQKIYGRVFQLQFVYVLLTVIVISVLFEGIFPMMSKTSTADLWDVLWYFTGGVVYYLVLFLHYQRKAKLYLKLREVLLADSADIAD